MVSCVRAEQRLAIQEPKGGEGVLAAAKNNPFPSLSYPTSLATNNKTTARTRARPTAPARCGSARRPPPPPAAAPRTPSPPSRPSSTDPSRSAEREVVRGTEKSLRNPGRPTTSSSHLIVPADYSQNRVVCAAGRESDLAVLDNFSLVRGKSLARGRRPHILFE